MRSILLRFITNPQNRILAAPLWLQKLPFEAYLQALQVALLRIVDPSWLHAELIVNVYMTDFVALRDTFIVHIRIKGP